MERTWLKQWPEYVPREAGYPLGKKPLFEYLRDNAALFPDRPALIYYGKELTYGQLDRMSEQFAHFLIDSGFGKGDRIALFLPSCPQYYIAQYGISKMGGIIVACSPMFKEWELGYELGDAGAKALVSLDLLYPVAAGACRECGIETIVATSLHDFLPESPAMNLTPMMSMPGAACPGAVELVDILSGFPSEPVQVAVDLGDIAQFQYTGGTTGLPKGAILTHGAKLFKASSVSSILAANLEYLGHRGPYSLLATLPTFHIAGMLGGVDAPVVRGNTQVLLTQFDPVAAMQAINRYKLQFFQATVPMNLAILDHPERRNYDLSSLKLSMTTSFGIQLSEEIAKRWRGETGGSRIVESAYGLTETHTFDTFMPLDRPKFVPGCQGIPIPGQNIKIVAFEDKTRDLPPGETGEIALKNPSVFQGYWNRPEETAAALVDGWVYTGDMGKFDAEGYLYYLGRRKEMMKVSGFSVFPEEVEAFLARHEAVASVAVIGVPDERKGEVIKAFVVLKPQFRGKITAEEIIARAGEGISSYKVPRHVEFIDALPMSGAGKVLRRVLRERA
ncbi:MAG: AMP-binding protein [Syntrophobacteraceae bacterium]